MCQALMEIMEPFMQQRDEENIEKGIEEGMKKGMKKGRIYGMVSAYRDLGVPENEILRKVQEKLQLSLEEAKEYL